MAYLLSISLHTHFNVIIAFLGSVTTGVKRCAISLYTLSSNILGSINISLKSSGGNLYSIDANSVLINTDLPDPVVPATKRCGVLLKSITSMLPDISLPIQIGIFNDVFLKLSSLNSSLIVTVSRWLFGTSTPKNCVPYICAILTAPTPILLDISSAKLIMVLILIPAAGSISNKVTTGPSFTFMTLISILKSEKTFSNNSEFDSILLSTFSFDDLLFDSRMSSDGEKYS